MSQKGLLPYPKEHYPTAGYTFWPDLAAAYYVKKTIAMSEEAGVPVVDWEESPPCVPQMRSIEDLWGLAKQEVYKRWWTATFDRQLKAHIRKVLLPINTEVPLRMKGRLDSAWGMARKARCTEGWW